MDAITSVKIISDLINNKCRLNHGAWDGDSVAVDVLTIPVGENGVVKRELSIPVCAACQKTLSENDQEWVLFFCTACGGSQWKMRALLRNKYSSDILQPMRYCPGCMEQDK